MLVNATQVKSLMLEDSLVLLKPLPPIIANETEIKIEISHFKKAEGNKCLLSKSLKKRGKKIWLIGFATSQ